MASTLRSSRSRRSTLPAARRAAACLGLAIASFAPCAARAEGEASDAGHPQSARWTSTWFRDPLFVELATGPTYLELLAVRGSRSAFPNMVSFRGWGPGVGVTAGLHALLFSVGVQAHWTHLSGSGDTLNSSSDAQVGAEGNFHLFTATLVGALRLPLGRVEPSLRLGLGWAQMTDYSTSAATGLSGPAADGWTARAGLGFDVRVWERLFVGFGVDGSVANLRRSGLAGAQCASGDPFCAELREDGDAIALAIFPYLSFSAHLL